MGFTLDQNMEGILFKVLSTVMIAIIGLLAIKVVTVILRKTLSKGKLATLSTFFVNATKLVLIVALIIMILNNLGVATSSLLTIVGAGAAAIALGLRDSLANVAGGIIILLTNPFKKGDEIEIRGSVTASGIVDEIDILMSKLHTWDNKIISVPNGTITTSILFNYTTAGLRRLDEKFSVGYDEDIDKVRAVLESVIAQEPYFTSEPVPIIGIAEHGDSAIVFDCKAWCKAEDYYKARYKLKEAVKKEFDKHNIEIPYIQIDIHNR